MSLMVLKKGLVLAATFCTHYSLLARICHQPMKIPKSLKNTCTARQHSWPFLTTYDPNCTYQPFWGSFGVIPKKNQPCRKMVDLLFPEGKSVNDSINPKLCSLRYIAKIDIKAAYCLIPVASKDRPYLGRKSVLPFGLRSAPKIFNAVVDALEWCMIKEGVNAIYR